jgi:hypothetical protein
MRRLIGGCALACALLACSRYRPPIQVDETGNQPPASSLDFSDPNRAFQLLSGFHAIEFGAWRWTMRRFAVALQPPPGAASAGAILALDFTVPEPVIARRKAVTLSVTADAVALPPHTYEQKGDYRYTAVVPAAVLNSGPVKFEFTLDRCLEAGEVDGRELGVVVRSVALQPARTGTPRISDGPAGRTQS